MYLVQIKVFNPIRCNNHTYFIIQISCKPFRRFNGEIKWEILRILRILLHIELPLRDSSQLCNL